MNIYRLLILLLFFPFSSCLQNDHDEIKVTFIVKSKNATNDTEIYIAGSHKDLGWWNPNEVKMKQEKDHEWRRSIGFKKGETVEYKFTQGSWDKEGADQYGKPLNNFHFKAYSDTSIIHEINYWKEDEITAEGQITGGVRYHRNLQWDGIDDRDLIVWLPPNYNESEQKYPVLYMHDGQNIFDPLTSTFKIDWQMDETSDSLIRNGVIEPMIIVGINSTDNRMKEYVPSKKGTQYMKFVVEKVKPLIDQEYRTLSDRAHTAVGGSSAGGTVSFMLLWEYNDIFSKAICMSPAFKIERINFVDDVESYQGPQKDLKVWIDNGGIGLEEKLQPGVEEMLQALGTKGYKEGRDYYWYRDRDASHNESAWAERTPKAMKWLFGMEKREK